MFDIGSLRDLLEIFERAGTGQATGFDLSVVGATAFALGLTLRYIVRKLLVWGGAKPADEAEVVSLKAGLKEREAVNRELATVIQENDRKIGELDADRADAYKRLSASEGALKQHQEIRTAMLSDEGELWSLHGAEPPKNYGELAHARARTIVVANMKGGVGKTTLVANLGAYFSRNREKRVLMIDLDYQGSLSIMTLRAAGLDISDSSLAKQALSSNPMPANVIESARDLNNIMSGGRLLTASYDFGAFENRLMLQWLFKESAGDVRYRLAEFLLSTEIQDRFDIILIDSAPRMTTATVNALCASHYLLIPTLLDRLSAETMSNFVGQARRILRDEKLNPGLDILGAVPTMSSGLNSEADARPAVLAGLKKWSPTTHIFPDIRRSAEFSNYAGTNIGYLKSKAIRDIIDPLGDEIWERIGL